MPYFVTILSSVNRSRVAKQQIFRFIDSEAQKSEEAAIIIALNHDSTVADNGNWR